MNPVRYPPSVPIMAHQPTDPSAIDNASITSSCERGSSSDPPHTRGIDIRNTPARCISRTIGSGRRRPRSISLAAARIFGSSSRTAASVRITLASVSVTVFTAAESILSAMLNIGSLSLEIVEFFVCDRVSDSPCLEEERGKYLVAHRLHSSNLVCSLVNRVELGCRSESPSLICLLYVRDPARRLFRQALRRRRLQERHRT